MAARRLRTRVAVTGAVRRRVSAKLRLDRWRVGDALLVEGREVNLAIFNRDMHEVIRRDVGLCRDDPRGRVAESVAQGIGDGP